MAQKDHVALFSISECITEKANGQPKAKTGPLIQDSFGNWGHFCDPVSHNHPCQREGGNHG